MIVKLKALVGTVGGEVPAEIAVNPTEVRRVSACSPYKPRDGQTICVVRCNSTDDGAFATSVIEMTDDSAHIVVGSPHEVADRLNA